MDEGNSYIKNVSIRPGIFGGLFVGSLEEALKSNALIKIVQSSDVEVKNVVISDGIGDGMTFSATEYLTNASNNLIMGMADNGIVVRSNNQSSSITGVSKKNKAVTTQKRRRKLFRP